MLQAAAGQREYHDGKGEPRDLLSWSIGRGMATTRCANCGGFVDNRDSFCADCGEALEAEEVTWAEPMGAVSLRHPPPGPPRPSRPVATVPNVVPPPFPPEPAITHRGSPREPHEPLSPPRPLDRVVTEARPNSVISEETPNSTYLGLRLLYNQRPEDPFDPLENSRYLWETFKRELIYGFLWFCGGVVSLPFFLVVAVVTRLAALTVVWIVCGAITWIVLWIILFFSPVPAMLSDWKYSVDGKAEVAASAFEHITWALRNRHTPIKSLRVRRISQPFFPTRDYLVLREGIFVGYISCFAYGEDLYIAWTLWLSISPFRFLLEKVLRLYRGVRFQESELYSTLRYENARAMREAMHSAAREGIDVAAGNLAARGQGTIGSDVPVDVSNLTI